MTAGGVKYVSIAILNDPHTEVSKHIVAAILSPIEEVRAIHLRAAEHLSELARDSGITRSEARGFKSM